MIKSEKKNYNFNTTNKNFTKLLQEFFSFDAVKSNFFSCHQFFFFLSIKQGYSLN